MKTSHKILHWTPRVLCILAILFVSLFALDSFSPNHTVWEQIAAFLIHLIPTYVLIAVLIVAWKWEIVGGIIFMAIGLGFMPWIYSHNYSMNGSIWTTLIVILSIPFPFVLVGALFVWEGAGKRKK